MVLCVYVSRVLSVGVSTIVSIAFGNLVCGVGVLVLILKRVVMSIPLSNTAYPMTVLPEQPQHFQPATMSLFSYFLIWKVLTFVNVYFLRLMYDL